MKYVKYKYPLSIRQLSQKIESSVQPEKFPFILNYRITKKGMLYGGIKDNKIWLTTYRTSRIFRGKMYEDGGYTVIEGRFCFPRYTIITYIVIVMVWVLSSFNTSVGFEDIVFCIVSVFIGAAWIFGLNYLFSRKGEKYVKAFLEKLEREYQI